MNYSKLIKGAWGITWHHRFLWVLGLLAGGAVGMPSASGSGGGGDTGIQWRLDQRELEQVSPALAAAANGLTSWATANAGLLAMMMGLVGLIVLALIVLSVIAQGGMARATADLAIGNPSSFRLAWAAGLRLFWRYLGLWLIVIAFGAAIAFFTAAYVGILLTAWVITTSPTISVAMVVLAWMAVVATFVVFAVRTLENTSLPRWAIVLGAALLALPIFPVLILAALGVSIVVAFAQRAIALEDVGPLSAFGSGWRVLRAHLAESLLAWAVNAAIALAAGLAGFACLTALFVAVGGPGALLVGFLGFTAPTVVYLGLGGFLISAAALVLVAIANTFFWNYWTLAYLQFTGRAATAA